MKTNRRAILGRSFALGLCALPLIAGLATSQAQADAVAEATSLELRPHAGQDEVVVLDAAMLADLPQVSFATTTIWTEGEVTFSGPTLAAILEAAGAGEGDLMLRAENDYVVEMPRAFIEDAAPIIATHQNGERFSRRDKGPLWLVFPYDSETRFQREDIYAFSVWQLVGIELVDG